MAGADGSGPRVWITRARPGADRTAAALTARGFTPIIGPVIALEPLDTPLDLTGVAGLAFTSRNGVAAFAARTPRRDWPVFTVGDATAEAARACGFADVRSAAGALDDLAALITAAWPADGGLILAPGPREPAGDLGGELAGRVTVRALPLYAAVETGVTGPAEVDIILVHSPRAALALAAQLTPADTRERLLVAISAAAAAPLDQAGFAEIRIAIHPTEASLLAALGNPVRPV
ncbi:MAG: uroporphyrinogen-III synthase [Brevundimonas sp.]|jgi:uroporphyrinogen-III synthase|uniref:uroporphyrinogen-III synthase n=1 Tax=Brevundimonas sp. TaxID=1871086 RepID=UPI002489AF60|nr:uroporphyrinogen-III synthase [Brevundimonas sp.]MDI1280370.1 uroporphyrinogen-III synthase [Brevundimonas sp.]